MSENTENLEPVLIFSTTMGFQNPNAAMRMFLSFLKHFDPKLYLREHLPALGKGHPRLSKKYNRWTYTLPDTSLVSWCGCQISVHLAYPQPMEEFNALVELLRRQLI